ncbi:hypothetical protein HUJ04_010656 [Dendroctonus ponderosae]|nr:hypothetical protein HUJ04_010656 [Dendroctonus ponderosae]
MVSLPLNLLLGWDHRFRLHLQLFHNIISHVPKHISNNAANRTSHRISNIMYLRINHSISNIMYLRIIKITPNRIYNNNMPAQANLGCRTGMIRNPTMSDPRLETRRPRQHDLNASHVGVNNRRPTNSRPGEHLRSSAHFGSTHSDKHIDSQHAPTNGQAYAHGRPQTFPPFHTQPPAKLDAQTPAQLPAQPQARPQGNPTIRPGPSGIGPSHPQRSAVRPNPYPLKPSNRPMNHTATTSRGPMPKVPISGNLEKTEKKILPDMTAPLPVPGENTENKPQRTPTTEDEEEFFMTF